MGAIETRLAGERGIRVTVPLRLLTSQQRCRLEQSHHKLRGNRVRPSIFGILGGQGADTENLLHAKRIADKLFGADYQWSVMASGRHQIPFTTMAALNASHVRVGLEDSLYAGRGKLAQSNAEQVQLIRHILEALSLEIASPEEARRILKLKGADHVNF